MDETYYEEYKKVLIETIDNLALPIVYNAVSYTHLTGWQQVYGKWYYMDQWGAMTTGWQEISSHWYYTVSYTHLDVYKRQG